VATRKTGNFFSARQDSVIKPEKEGGGKKKDSKISKDEDKIRRHGRLPLIAPRPLMIRTSTEHTVAGSEQCSGKNPNPEGRQTAPVNHIEENTGHKVQKRP